MELATKPIHVPVMLESVLTHLAPVLTRPDAVFVDCTLGLGGHTAAVLDRFPNARAIGIDRDPQALARSRERLAPFGDRVQFIPAVFDEYPELGLGPVAAILADLGLSSLQIDSPERGFAYSVDVPLDMRMGDEGPSALDVVNDYEPADLIRILREYGEEREAKRITAAILTARPITTSGELVAAIAKAVPPSRPGHPAKRTFQAIRIEVNRELTALDGLLPAALESLTVGGRFAVLSYHSLEDRRVKTAFRAASTDTAPRGLPVVPEKYLAKYALITKGAERPSESEIEQNPRAASARLRVIERRAA